MSCNWDLLNRADYEDFHQLKQMLILYNTHERNAARGDTVSAAIYVDLKTAIYSGVLTEKQLEAVELFCMHNMTYESIGQYLDIGHPRVIGRVHRAVRSIQKSLLSGNLYRSMGQDCLDSLL